MDSAALAEAMALINQHKISGQNALLIVSGKATLADVLLGMEIGQASEAWKGMPEADWPPFKIVWDVDPAHFHLALDGTTASECATSYPNLVVRSVSVADLMADIFPGRIPTEKPWEGSHAVPTATLIERWRRGLGVTPPLVEDHQGKTNIIGGNHRFAVVRAKHVSEMPILLDQSIEAALASRMTSLGPYAP